ncbi:hypothetical protein OK016_02810 [Vibrio chagasii]|nr:hypothetical protein [Vibrio chagasii]
MNTWLVFGYLEFQGQMSPKKVQVIYWLDQSYYFPDDQATRNWLTDNVNASMVTNADNACDGDQLSQCLGSQ